MVASVTGLLGAIVLSTIGCEHVASFRVLWFWHNHNLVRVTILWPNFGLDKTWRASQWFSCRRWVVQFSAKSSKPRNPASRPRGRAVTIGTVLAAAARSLAPGPGVLFLSLKRVAPRVCGPVAGRGRRHSRHRADSDGFEPRPPFQLLSVSPPPPPPLMKLLPAAVALRPGLGPESESRSRRAAAPRIPGPGGARARLGCADEPGAGPSRSFAGPGGFLAPLRRGGALHAARRDHRTVAASCYPTPVTSEPGTKRPLLLHGLCFISTR